MKKIFCVLVLLAAAASVYPQAAAKSLELKAQVYGGFDLVYGNTNKHTDAVWGGINSGKGLIEAKGEVGNFGGWLRLGYEFEVDWFGDFDIWWRPSEIFAFYLTYNDDGHFALDNITGWNYFGFPGDVLGLAGCAGSGAFYGGFTRGAFISVNPIKALELNLGMNMFTPHTTEFMFKTITFQAAYTIGEIGKAGFTYEGDYMTKDDLNDNPVLSFYFNLTKLKFADFDFGLSFRFREVRNINNVKQTRVHPFNLGVGTVFDIKKIHFKSRLHLGFAGSNKTESGGSSVKTKDPFVFGLDVLPSYSFKENFLTGYLNTGIGLSKPDNGKAEFLWRINPYIVIGNEETAAFYAGAAIFNTPIYHKELHFSVSVGLSITFQ